MACKNRVFVSTRVEAAKLLPSSVAPATELLDSTTVSGLAVRRNVGLGSPTNSQPGRLRYVAQASGLRVLAASSRQFWWYLQDAPAGLLAVENAAVRFNNSGLPVADHSRSRLASGVFRRQRRSGLGRL